MQRVALVLHLEVPARARKVLSVIRYILEGIPYCKHAKVFTEWTETLEDLDAEKNLFQPMLKPLHPDHIEFHLKGKPVLIVERPNA